MPDCADAVVPNDQASMARSQPEVRLITFASTACWPDMSIPCNESTQDAVVVRYGLSAISLFHGAGWISHGLPLGNEQCVALIDAYDADTGKLEVDNDV